MKRKLLRLLAWACTLTLIMGMAVTATAADVAHVLVIEWKDENNVEEIRPDSVETALGGTGVTVSKAGGWAGIADGAKDATWTVTAPAGYTADVGTETAGITVATLTHEVERKTITASAVWADEDDANGVRPSEVRVQLLADGANYGPPITLSASGWTGTWTDVPAKKKNADIVYTVKAVNTPEFYAVSESGTTVTYTLTTGTLQISSTLIGAPAGAPTGSLEVKIEGPDHRMPMTVNYSAFSGGSYTVGNVLPGAYLVTATNAQYLIEEHYLVPAETATQDATYVKAGTTGQTNLKITWTDTIPDRERNEHPETSFNNLKFEIIGPDESLPMTITYHDFVDGRYDLSHLKPGSYAVVERDADTLIDYYTLQLQDPETKRIDSITGVTFDVVAGEKASADQLFNHYRPSLTPPPQEDLVDIQQE